MRRRAIWNSLHPPTAVASFCPLLSPPTHTIPHSQVKITPPIQGAGWGGSWGGRGGSLLDVAEQLLLVHLEAALLPQLPQLLQRGAQLLARGDAQAPQVVAVDGEAGHRPAAEPGQQPRLALVLEQLTHLQLGVHLPVLRGKTDEQKG